MKTRAILALTAVAGLAGAANAQVTSSTNVTFQFAYTEAPGGNGNGIIETGESALIRWSSISFTGQNTVGSFNPPVGTFGSGTIRGLGAGFIDLNGTANNGGNAQGAWNVDNTAVPPLGSQDPWNLVGQAGAGTPANGGANLQNIQMGQFPISPASIDPTNPIIDSWMGIWTPASYAARTVTFTSVPGAASGGFAASVVFRTGTSSIASAFVAAANVAHGSVNIPVAPAPASLALLGLGALVAGRRRR